MVCCRRVTSQLTYICLSEIAAKGNVVNGEVEALLGSE